MSFSQPHLAVATDAAANLLCYELNKITRPGQEGGAICSANAAHVPLREREREREPSLGRVEAPCASP